jgi:hypothetical protein
MDPSFEGFTPSMEAAFARLDEQMAREGFSTGSNHPFPHGSKSASRKKGKRGGGVNTKSASQVMSAYRTADPSLMGTSSKRSSKKRSRNHAHAHVVDSGEFARPNSRGPPRTLEPLGASSSGGRAGTPLKLNDMTDSALIMTETGKFEANASAGFGGQGGAAKREKKEPKKKLTDAEMEVGGIGIGSTDLITTYHLPPTPTHPQAKKVLLPYLDRLDYIDVELSRRNLGEERMGAGIAGTVHSPNDSAPLSSRSSNPSTARSHPETNSVPSYPTTPINIIETDGFGEGEDMFFRAPTPSPRR